MNAIDLLKSDHRAVDELFQRIESTPPSKHTPIFKKIKDELDAHARVEEKLFYPALKAKGDKALADITAEGFEEHAQIKKFLQEIARSTSTDKREAKLKVLMEDTRHHVKEEEDEMFPLVEDQFSPEELEALGQKMEAEKKNFQKANRIPARREEPKGAIAAVLEKAKEFVGGLTGGTVGEEAGGGSSKGSNSPKSRASTSSNGKARAASSSKKASGGAKASASASKNSGSGGKKSSTSSGSASKKTSGSGAPGKKASSGRASEGGTGKKGSAGSGSAGKKVSGGPATGGKKASASTGSGSSKGTSAPAKGGNTTKKSTGGSKAAGSKKASGGSRAKSSAK